MFSAELDSRLPIFLGTWHKKRASDEALKTQNWEGSFAGLNQQSGLVPIFAPLFR